MWRDINFQCFCKNILQINQNIGDEENLFVNRKTRHEKYWTFDLKKNASNNKTRKIFEILLKKNYKMTKRQNKLKYNEQSFTIAYLTLKQQQKDKARELFTTKKNEMKISRNINITVIIVTRTDGKKMKDVV